MRDTTPYYNLKVIVRETGIKPDTLRAWERRYDLLAPARTAGGHRLYSQRDLETIRWLMARQEEGLSIGNAVQLWHDMEAAGRDPLQQTAAPSPTAGLTAGMVDDLATMREAWLQACMALDTAGAEKQLALALARYAPEQVCLEIIQRGLAQIGEWWYENRATVQQEHFATALAQRQVNALLAAAPPPFRPHLIHLACPPQEQHTFPLLLLALLLRNRGWPVAYFGANVPITQLEGTIAVSRPSLVVLAAQTLPAAGHVLEMARFMQLHKIRLAYGGRIFNEIPALRQRIPGHFLGEDLRVAVANIGSFLVRTASTPAVAPVPAVYRQALESFDRQQRLIDGQAWRILHEEGWTQRLLEMVNLHLAQNIRAALTLGDISLVDHELSWVHQLLTSHQIPPHSLGRYLAVYEQVARERLDRAGQLIVDWLATANSDLYQTLNTEQGVSHEQG